MGEFEQIFEGILEQESQEDVLMLRIAQEIEELVPALKGDYWFHEDINVSESDVLDWLRENTPNFYEMALKDPGVVEGNDNFTRALEALGLMKEWSDEEE